jgi:hypothetical protein
LSTNWPAASGTNRTVFVHINGADCSGGGMAMMAGSGSGTSAGAGASAKPTKKSSGEPPEWAKEFISYEFPKLPWDEKTQVSIAESYPGILPSLPWDEKVQEEIICQHEAEAKRLSDTGSSVALMSGESGCVPAGFYKVVRSGVHLLGLTNGTPLSGTVGFEVEIGWPDEDELLYVGFEPTEASDAPSGVRYYHADETNRSPLLVWETARVPNGTYVLKPTAFFSGNIELGGTPISVTVSNPIQIPDWFDTFGTNLPIRAKIATNTAPYTITIRNDSGQIVRVLTGTATNFTIDTNWNGLDSNGVPASVDGFVEVTISYNPSLTVKSWKEYVTSLAGQWLIAHQNLYSGINSIQFQNNMQQVNDFAAANEGTVTGTPHVLPSVQNFTEWFQMLNYLKQADCRNLYYFGHGGPAAIGFGNNAPGYGLRAPWVRRGLKNELEANGDYQNRHPFRFVFLDGCRTAMKDSEWPITFGCRPVPMSVAAYNALGTPARAFVGWKSSIYTVPAFDSSRQTFTVRFFQNWVGTGTPLRTALFNASVGTIGQTVPDGFPSLQILGGTNLVSAPQ